MPISRPPVAWLPVGSAMAAVVVLLTATSTRYGYHRDELYFRMLQPGWGYDDQPPLTPWLARAATTLFGDTLWAMRIPATLAVAAAVLLTVLVVRELGGGRLAQGLCAWAFAFTALPLLFGHILLTGTIDLAAWAAVILFVVRALLRENPRWWLAAGAAVGVSLYNKHLIVLLLVGLFVGLLTVGPRPVLRSPWLWAGVGLAVVIGLPNLIYQVANDWPQLAMAAAIEENKGGEARVMLLPFQLLLIGPPLFVIAVVGFRAIFRRPSWWPLRAVAVAYPVVLVLTLISGGQIYYPFGLLAFLFAAGCIPAASWVSTVGRRWTMAIALGLNTLVALVLALPLIPESVLGATPVPAINQGTRDQVGWPTYVRQVALAYSALPAFDQGQAVLLTGNYGEAGALHRYGPEYGLPDVYSGHNELHKYGPPPDSARTVVAIGFRVANLSRRFERCEQVGTLDNGVDVDNEEQDVPIVVCHNPIGGWSAIWPDFHHYD